MKMKRARLKDEEDFFRSPLGNVCEKKFVEKETGGEGG